MLAAVRINPLETEGRADLAAVMRGRPDIVLMSKVAERRQVVALAEAVLGLEYDCGIPSGTTEIVPNIESARGLIQTFAIATASPRVGAPPGATCRGAVTKTGGADADTDGSEPTGRLGSRSRSLISWRRAVC